MSLIKHLIYFNVIAVAASVSLDNVQVLYMYAKYGINWDSFGFLIATEILCIFTMYIVINRYRTDIKWSEIA